MGVRSLESTEPLRVAAGRSQDKTRDLIRERYSAYISAGADYDSKWNRSVGVYFLELRGDVVWHQVCAKEPVERWPNAASDLYVTTAHLHQDSINTHHIPTYSTP